MLTAGPGSFLAGSYTARGFCGVMMDADGVHLFWEGRKVDTEKFARDRAWTRRFKMYCRRYDRRRKFR